MNIRQIKSIFLMAVKYLRNRPFATVTSVFSIGISIVFLVIVGNINFAISKTATEGAVKYPLIVGSEASSDIRMVMSTIFNVDKPAGTIPFKAYKTIIEDKRVDEAYPVALADNYRSFPIIGTNQDFIDNLNAETIKGELDITELSHVVIGFNVAQRTGLRIGDTFFGSHGMIGSEGAHEHKELKYEVKGIMSPLNGPEDSNIFSRYESVWHIHDKHITNCGKHEHEDKHEHGHEHEKKHKHKHEHGHEHENKHEHEHGHEEEKLMLTSNRLTAVLVKTKSPAYTGQMEREWSLHSGTQAVDTGRTIRKVLQYLNKAEDIISVFTTLFLGIIIIMIMVTIVMSLNERRKELALMRSLGIGKFTISCIVMLESLIMTIFGALSGVLIGHFMLWWFSHTINRLLQVSVEPFYVTNLEFKGLLITIVAGQILAVLSMFKTYRMNIVSEIAKD